MNTLPILFGLYLDKANDYIACGGSKGIDILDTPIHVLLYDDYIILVFKFHAGSKHHLNALHDLYYEKGSIINLGRTMDIILHIRTNSSISCIGFRS